MDVRGGRSLLGSMRLGEGEGGGGGRSLDVDDLDGVTVGRPLAEGRALAVGLQRLLEVGVT